MANDGALLMPKLYAKQGERVTCMKGHHIATFNRDVASQSEACAAALNWVRAAPKRYQVIGDAVCHNCGSPYERLSIEGGLEVFMDGKWREGPIEE